MNEQLVLEAVEGLKPALDADGFDLLVNSVSDSGTVEVVLAARPDACLDCLVPDDTLTQILDRAIRDKEPDLANVVLTKTGFDPAH